MVNTLSEPTISVSVLDAFIESNCNDGKGMLSTKRLLTLPYKYKGIHIHITSYLLTPWGRVLLEKLTGSAASQ